MASVDLSTSPWRIRIFNRVPLNLLALGVSAALAYFVFFEMLEITLYPTMSGDHWTWGEGFSLGLVTDIVLSILFGYLIAVPYYINQESVRDYLDLRPALNLFSAMIGSLVVAIPLRWVYLAKGLGQPSDPEIASGLLALPLVITAIVFCIKYSLPLAFALVGILAGLRVKTELNSKSDSYFTFASIGVGLAIGAGYLAIAIALAAFFSLTMLIVTPVSTSYRTEI